MRPLVEPFRRQQFRGGADRCSLALEFDFRPNENLRRGMDRHRAEPERPDERNRALEKPDIPHRKSWRHGRPQSSALWVKKCLRMRCTSSVKTGFAITSSERLVP